MALGICYGRVLPKGGGGYERGTPVPYPPQKFYQTRHLIAQTPDPPPAPRPPSPPSTQQQPRPSPHRPRSLQRVLRQGFHEPVEDSSPGALSSTRRETAVWRRETQPPPPPPAMTSLRQIASAGNGDASP